MRQAREIISVSLMAETLFGWARFTILLIPAASSAFQKNSSNPLVLESTLSQTWLRKIGHQGKPTAIQRTSPRWLHCPGKSLSFASHVDILLPSSGPSGGS